MSLKNQDHSRKVTCPNVEKRAHPKQKRHGRPETAIASSSATCQQILPSLFGSKDNFDLRFVVGNESSLV